MENHNGNMDSYEFILSGKLTGNSDPCLDYGEYILSLSA